MEFESAEVFRLALALALLPGLLFFIRRIRVVPGRAAWMTCLGAIYASYAFTIMEGVAAPGLFNMLQHAMYAVAAVAAAAGAIATRSSAELRGERR